MKALIESGFLIHAAILRKILSRPMVGLNMPPAFWRVNLDRAELPF
jgi:hypothetical protein